MEDDLMAWVKGPIQDLSHERAADPLTKVRRNEPNRTVESRWYAHEFRA